MILNDMMGLVYAQEEGSPTTTHLATCFFLLSHHNFCSESHVVTYY